VSTDRDEIASEAKEDDSIEQANDMGDIANEIKEEVIVRSQGYVRGTYSTHKEAKEQALFLLQRFIATGGGGSSKHILNR
jgi:hypothetical protein